MVNFRRAAPATVLLSVILIASAACAGDRTPGVSAEAEKYPSKDVRLIVHAAAGGASDMTARALATELEKDLGRSIVVENRPGASGSTAMRFLASAKADGYTLGYLPVEVSMLGHRGYPVKPESYTMLGQVVNVPAVVVVPAESPHKTLADLIEAAKSDPGEVSVANSGPGSIWEAATTLLGQQAGVGFKPVPFDGGAPAVAAAAGDKVDAAVAGASEVAPSVKDGRVRALAVLDAERSQQLPDVPTGKEEGYDVTVGGWGGIGAPANLPQPVAQRLRDAVSKAAQSPAFTQTLTKAGAVPTYRSAEEFATFTSQEYERFAAVLRPAGS
ncbi:tripartite tricarboxylate transporter substrate binding protein [Nonomuraea sp. K274]|uniref:Tripartite tricarboxylate transporter substrate binding protein n=1 Tax=Nonomuraea cypriaca TaxID=1187855 RepID=A0A931A7U7_9ACTN|nr:tripartite tricarboxylate transporter substrate binding protein [Nonomuraea cypriaca]MBF8185598.1 tripartite tricarboxylate transporter substrate binding protein [Nonomuraea cypriaca]